MLLDKLAGIAARFDEVGRLITEPDVVNDMKRYIQLNKEYKELTRVVAFYNEYKNILENLTGSDLGIKGALYIDIITLSLETGDKSGAGEWYKRMLLSDSPRLELYVKNLNSRGIRF